MNRREFSEPVKRAIRERSGGVCECYLMPSDIAHMFPKGCTRSASEIDHIFADVLETDKSADLTAEDGAHLSNACHKIKTASDQKMRAKRNAHQVRRDRHQKPKTVKRPLKSRGFDKTFRKRMDGSVVRRDA